MEKEPKKDRKRIPEPQYDIENLVSSTDYTGIAPAPVLNGGMVDSYAAMLNMANPLFSVSNPVETAENPDDALDRKKEEVSKRARKENDIQE